MTNSNTQEGVHSYALRADLGSTRADTRAARDLQPESLSIIGDITMWSFFFPIHAGSTPQLNLVEDNVGAS